MPPIIRKSEDIEICIPIGALLLGWYLIEFCPCDFHKIMAAQQSRNWMITINNPTKKDEFKRWLADKSKYFVYQHEVGEEGTPHIQGYIIFRGNQRLAGLKKLHAKAHWEVRKGTHEQARAYCTKKDTAVSEPIEVGEPPAPGKRSDLIAMKETIDTTPNIKMEEVWDKHFASALRYSAHIKEYIALKATKRNWKTEVIVLWGPPGTGKSKLCHDVSPDAYVKDCTAKWWDNYDGVSDVILDDFYGGIQYTTLLSILDRYRCQVECKGGVINFAPKRLFITSNKKWSEWYSRPEGTDNEAWVVKMAAIERRIDTLLTLPELGVIHTVKGEIPTKPVVPIEDLLAAPVIPLPRIDTFVIDYDEIQSDEADSSDESSEEEELPPMPKVARRRKEFVPPRKLSKKRRHHSSSDSSESDY